MSDMILAGIASMEPLVGWVATFPFDMAIAAKYNGKVWEALYGLKTGEHGGRFELPSCFVLADEMTDALDRAAAEGKNNVH